MSGQLWGGRFAEGMAAAFAKFNASLSFDGRLAQADIQGSVAYAAALHDAGVLSHDELSRLNEGLQDLAADLATDETILTGAIATGIEDVHSFVEGELTKRCGDVARKLHTGRSRNDQVTTDLRLWLREAILDIKGVLNATQAALIGAAERYPDAVIPGYTHLQKAQPVLWAHYCLAYVEMLSRDQERLDAALQRVNILPLGSGALAGNSVGIDRDMLARSLGFAGITRNSLDAVSDRDYVIETVGALSLVMLHLSRLSEDLIIYATTEFGFVTLSDCVATGSSLMPQKKNPDALELIRGKSGRVFGHHMALLTTMKGLPLAYNKDMQEDKEALFDAVDTVKSCLEVMTIVLGSISLNAANLAAASRTGFMNATEAADYLVRKGVPFRDAHHAVGRLVLLATAKEQPLEDLALADFKSIHPAFAEDVRAALQVTATLATKSAPGGTAPATVKSALASARGRLDTVYCPAP